MIIPDHKKALMTVMARRKADGTRVSDPVAMKTEVSKDESGELDGRHSAMQDFMSAQAEKSPQKALEAMANFVDMHMSRVPKAE